MGLQDLLKSRSQIRTSKHLEIKFLTHSFDRASESNPCQVVVGGMILVTPYCDMS